MALLTSAFEHVRKEIWFDPDPRIGDGNLAAS
jgi:hypothetical protein